MITFYDIHSNRPSKAWNAHPWKVRYILNYKGIPYKSEFVEYPDIEEVSKKIGIKPTGSKADGTPLYTLPAIYDSSTGKALADSFAIARYLDATYPDTPKVAVEGSEVLTMAFVDTFTVKFYPFFQSLMPSTIKLYFTPRSIEYILQRFTGGKSLEEVVTSVSEEDRKKGFKILKEATTQVDGWFNNAGWGDKKFMMGDTPTFADFGAAGCFAGLRIYLGEDSEEWKEVMGWNNGRWGKLMESFKEWEVVN